jgi:hypothetical protein
MVATASTGARPGAGQQLALISARRLAGAVVATSAIVWIIGVARILLLEAIGTDTPLTDLSRLDLDSDLTMPSWYSSLLLASLALLAILVGLAGRSKRPTDVWRWNLLGVLFVLLSMDEAIALHEMSLAALDRFEMPAIFTFGWIPFAIVLIVILGTLYVPFLLRLPRKLAVGMLVSAAVYVFGVIGMGMINGVVFEALSFRKDFNYSLLSSVEEAFEIAGLTLLIVVLIRHLTEGEPTVFGFRPR